MFERMKTAARLAAAERRLTAGLAERQLAQGAKVSVRAADGQLRASIVLAETADLPGEEIAPLEDALAAAAEIESVTVVQTRHRSRGNVPRPSPARISAGHDNPLALPADPDASPKRARPAKQRPAGASRVIAVASGKGGVGKTTIAAHLALALAARGHRVGLLDLDIYGPSLPVMFDLDGKRPRVEDGQVLPLEAAGLLLMSVGFLVDEDQALAWRGPMVMGAAKQLLDEVRWGQLDYLVIDTPPGTGDAHLTLLQRTTIDAAVIVTTPSPLALADVKRGAALFAKMDAPVIGLIENMATLPDGTALFGPGLSAGALAEIGVPLMGRLALDPALATPIGQLAPSARPETLDQVAQVVCEKLPPSRAS